MNLRAPPATPQRTVRPDAAQSVPVRELFTRPPAWFVPDKAIPERTRQGQHHGGPVKPPERGRRAPLKE